MIASFAERCLSANGDGDSEQTDSVQKIPQDGEGVHAESRAFLLRHALARRRIQHPTGKKTNRLIGQHHGRVF
jgi:hypothetical protein